MRKTTYGLQGLPGGAYQIEHYASADISHDTARQVADYYRYIFNNNGHYLVFPEAFEFVSAQQVFGGSAEVRVALPVMDALRRFPRHPVTQESAVFFHHPQATAVAIGEKLKQAAHLVLLTELASREIVGFLLGYKTTVRKIFEMEGWASPFYYAGLDVDIHRRDFSNFLQKINAALYCHPTLFDDYIKQHGTLSAETEVYSWNCMGKSLGSKDYLYYMLQKYCEIIPQNYKDELLTFCDSRFAANSYQMFRAVGYIDVPGVLTSEHKPLSAGDSILQLSTLLRSAELFQEKVRRHFGNSGCRSVTSPGPKSSNVSF